MRVYLHLGLPFSIHLTSAFVIETDFRRRAFVRIGGIGQWWFERGVTSFERWERVKAEHIAVPFIA